MTLPKGGYLLVFASGKATGGTMMLMRDQSKELWGKFTPTLRQMLEAYETDVWQPRQNFRCYGFCPLTDCEFWKPKRVK